MQFAAASIITVLLIPYVGWGIYLLRMRFHYREELPPLLEAVTLVAVGVALAIEIYFLNMWLQESVLQLVFAVLGLVTSAMALYGHLLISLLSRAIVGMMAPQEHIASDRPRLGPVEALERAGELDAALNEYRVLARIYPHDPSLPWRIAELLTQLSRETEALPWYERAMRRAHGAKAVARVVHRYCDVLLHKVQQPHLAADALTTFCERFPETPEAAQAYVRMAQLMAEAPVASMRADRLSALEEDPMREDSAPAEAVRPAPRLRLEELDQDEARRPPLPQTREGERPSSIMLEAMDDVPDEERPPRA